MIYCKDGWLHVDPQGLPRGDAGPAADDALVSLAEWERRYILRVLQNTGNIVEGEKGAARILGLHPSTLRHRMMKLGIPRTA